MTLEVKESGPDKHVNDQDSGQTAAELVPQHSSDMMHKEETDPSNMTAEQIEAEISQLLLNLRSAETDTSSSSLDYDPPQDWMLERVFHLGLNPLTLIPRLLDPDSEIERKNYYTYHQINSGNSKWDLGGRTTDSSGGDSIVYKVKNQTGKPVLLFLSKETWRMDAPVPTVNTSTVIELSRAQTELLNSVGVRLRALQSVVNYIRHILENKSIYDETLHLSEEDKRVARRIIRLAEALVAKGPESFKNTLFAKKKPEFDNQAELQRKVKNLIAELQRYREHPTIADKIRKLELKISDRKNVEAADYVALLESLKLLSELESNGNTISLYIKPDKNEHGRVVEQMLIRADGTKSEPDKVMQRRDERDGHLYHEVAPSTISLEMKAHVPALSDKPGQDDLPSSLELVIGSAGGRLTNQQILAIAEQVKSFITSFDKIYEKQNMSLQARLKIKNMDRFLDFLASIVIDNKNQDHNQLRIKIEKKPSDNNVNITAQPETVSQRNTFYDPPLRDILTRVKK